MSLSPPLLPRPLLLVLNVMLLSKCPLPLNPLSDLLLLNLLLPTQPTGD